MSKNTPDVTPSKKDIWKLATMAMLAVPTMGMSTLPLAMDVAKSSGKSLRKLLK
jgi:hypothetical protein